ncbi:MAG: hypothetical protein IMZ47_07275, partial [Firmicutes bacterium]|nr:hypothetical protein [Bacillota bacterium]
PLFSKDIEIHNEIYLGAFGLRSAVRMGQWKFIDNQGEKTNELFNLEGDPEERINVINKEKTLAKEMHHKLWEFKARWSKQLSWRDMPASADI